MHNLLEKYLTALSAHLGPLPRAQREEELTEIRQHLRDAMMVNQELGQSEDEAAAKAMRQLGTPDALGANITWAWRRGEQRKTRRSVWGAVACMTAFMLITNGLLLYAISADLQGRLNTSYPWLFGTGMALISSMILALQGWLTGLVFPRGAVQGVRKTVLMANSLSIISVCYSAIHYKQIQIFYGIGWSVLFGVISWLIASYAARAGSRRRLRSS